jgi:hypothetical protein
MPSRYLTSWAIQGLRTKLHCKFQAAAILLYLEGQIPQTDTLLAAPLRPVEMV